MTNRRNTIQKDLVRNAVYEMDRTDSISHWKSLPCQVCKVRWSFRCGYGWNAGRRSIFI